MARITCAAVQAQHLAGATSSSSSSAMTGPLESWLGVLGCVPAQRPRIDPLQPDCNPSSAHRSGPRWIAAKRSDPHRSPRPRALPSATRATTPHVLPIPAAPKQEKTK